MKKLILQAGMMCSDFVMTFVALYGAFWLRFEGNIPQGYIDQVWQHGWILGLLAVAVFFVLGMYNNMWKFASIYELSLIVASVTFFAIIVWGYFQVVPASLPRSIYILFWMLFLGMVGASRLSFRAYASWRLRKFFGRPGSNILVIGAGQAGSMVIKEIFDHPHLGRPRAVLDDDPSKHGLRSHGIKVLGGMDKLQKVVDDFSIDEIIVAMPSAPEPVIREILNQCKETGCKLKRLPGLYDIIDGKATMDQIKTVEIADLLGRPEIDLFTDSIVEYLTCQVVLVTGAGGSIGAELCWQIASFNPKQLIMLDIYENNLYQVQLELQQKHPTLSQKVLIASIRDAERIEEVFEQYKPDVVFHAAAHKHVPLMEASPQEAIKNNLLGTINVANSADRHGVKKFIFISTDKAVNPTNVMGASKRMAEIALQQKNDVSKTEFVAVRFGNVLGSQGSVIPIFQEQIANGGPVTVTHPNITRYFMTIPEAVQLVIQAGALAKGGEVFVLDMGDPVRIVDLAKDLIRLSGYRPEIDIDIVYTGIRPGEKMYEELNLEDELVDKTCHEKIFVSKSAGKSETLMAELKSLAEIVCRQVSYKPDYLIKTVLNNGRQKTS